MAAPTPPVGPTSMSAIVPTAAPLAPNPQTPHVLTAGASAAKPDEHQRILPGRRFALFTGGPTPEGVT